MQWVIALIPTTVAVVGAVVFFLAGRETPASAPPPTSGSPTPTEPPAPPDWPPQTPEWQPAPIRVDWQRRPQRTPRACGRASLPTPSGSADPAPSSFAGRFWADSATLELERRSRVSDLPPIWSSFWGSNWSAETRSASGTLPLPRQSTPAPLTTAATPAWSAWSAPRPARRWPSWANTSSGRKPGRYDVY